MSSGLVGHYWAVWMKQSLSLEQLRFYLNALTITGFASLETVSMLPSIGFAPSLITRLTVKHNFGLFPVGKRTAHGSSTLHGLQCMRPD